MRNKIWYNLSNILFKAEYTALFSKFASKWGNIYSFFLAFASAASVGTWVVWEKYPVVWASIVAVSQVLHIAKPYLPFLKHDKEYLEMSYQFKFLFLDYEKLWYDLEKKRKTNNEIEDLYFDLQKKSIEIEQSHKQNQCPDFDSILSKANQETRKILSNTFS